MDDLRLAQELENEPRASHLSNKYTGVGDVYVFDYFISDQTDTDQNGAAANHTPWRALAYLTRPRALAFGYIPRLHLRIIL